MKFALSTLLLFLFYLNLVSQTNFKIGGYKLDGKISCGLLVGHQGFKNNYGELGLGINFGETRKTGSTLKKITKTYNYTKTFTGISSSLLYDYKDTKMTGVKVSAWIQFYVAFGLEYSNLLFEQKTYNLINYKIGIELLGLSLTYDHYINTRQINKKFSNYYFSLRYYIPIIYKKE
ncbi:MAG: hypothetical protein NTW49_00610 [Bacteroidia bacterium]|nr:hypothetical protein [Bacteroidia bacterium]